MAYIWNTHGAISWGRWYGGGGWPRWVFPHLYKLGRRLRRAFNMFPLGTAEVIPAPSRADLCRGERPCRAWLSAVAIRVATIAKAIEPGASVVARSGIGDEPTTVGGKAAGCVTRTSPGHHNAADPLEW